MGINRYKVEYKCDCGCDYGSCGRRSFFLLAYNRSIDVGAIFHKNHADEPDAKLVPMGHFGDNALHALITVLQTDESKWDDKDIEEWEQVKYS